MLTLLEMSVISGQQVVWRRAPLTTLRISMASDVTDTTYGNTHTTCDGTPFHSTAREEGKVGERRGSVNPKCSYKRLGVSEYNLFTVLVSGNGRVSFQLFVVVFDTFLV